MPKIINIVLLLFFFTGGVNAQDSFVNSKTCNEYSKNQKLYIDSVCTNLALKENKISEVEAQYAISEGKSVDPAVMDSNIQILAKTLMRVSDKEAVVLSSFWAAQVASSEASKASLNFLSKSKNIDMDYFETTCAKYDISKNLCKNTFNDISLYSERAFIGSSDKIIDDYVYLLRSGLLAVSIYSDQIEEYALLYANDPAAEKLLTLRAIFKGDGAIGEQYITAYCYRILRLKKHFSGNQFMRNVYSLNKKYNLNLTHQEILNLKGLSIFLENMVKPSFSKNYLSDFNEVFEYYDEVLFARNKVSSK